MRDYEFVKLGQVIDGTQTVEFFRRNDRPTTPYTELLRERNIPRVQEQTGTTTDLDTGEETPVMTNVPDKYHKWVIDHLEAMTQAERDQRDAYDTAQRIATITPELWQQAVVFKTILERHFGVGAVINQDVTAESVTAYFISRNITETSGTTDAADAMILTQGFEAIKAWTGTDNVWTFPWEMLP